MATGGNHKAVQPPPFLQHPGEPSVPFRPWFMLLESYFRLIDRGQSQTNQLTENDKKDILVSLLGAEGLKQFLRNPVMINKDQETWDSFHQAVKQQFDHPILKIQARHDFFTRMQGQSETVREYVTALRSIAAYADLDFTATSLNSLLATQLTIGCNNKECQERLLQHPAIDFDQFLQILQAAETASTASGVIRGSTSTTHAQNKVHFRQPQKQPQQKPGTFQGQGQAKDRFKPILENIVCYNCGNKGHHARSDSCPARGKTCSNCSKKNHFAKCCKSNPKSPAKAFNQKIVTVQQSSHSKPKCCNLESVPPLQNHTTKVTQIPRKKFWCTLFVNNGQGVFVKIRAEADSAADLTTITEAAYNKHFTAVPLQFTGNKLLNFDQSPIPGVKGFFTTEVLFHERETTVDIYVVPNHCAMVLGKDLIHKLKCILDGETFTVRSLGTTDPGAYIRQKYPKLLSTTLGTYPDFVHHISVTTDAKPVITKLATIPLSRRELTQAECANMAETGIWEKIDKSSWVHRMVGHCYET